MSKSLCSMCTLAVTSFVPSTPKTLPTPITSLAKQCPSLSGTRPRASFCRPKKRNTRPQKRSMEVRLSNSSFVQVGGRQERFFWRVPVPGDDGNGAQRGMDLVDQVQAPLGRIQPDDARTQPGEAHGPFE